MALLELQDIGKIYATTGNIAVGIRGVDLKFERGEFVAITGASGSGKSTLLNVISGMDTYEEGELYIEGSSTSHYVQADWEEYRKKYISFIFQDYNIIESFTVLQNVELALMHITDRKKRRARAVELLNRVGLGDRLNQRGSKLSGGQKQRTVIARALAKDSPIILADEPTGNLDSKTSDEIIELLREVSVNKLLIVVTHSFDSVAHFATRHIRIFDGAVESDRPIKENISEKQESEDTAENDKPQDTSLPEPTAQPETKTARTFREIKKTLKNGGTLGGAIFRSTPKLTVFICFLLILGALAIFAVTSLCGDGFTLFEKYTMFTHLPGRVVIVKRDGSPMSEADAEALKIEYGASSHIACDILLDYMGYITYVDDNGWTCYQSVAYSPFRDVSGKIVGRMPDAANEVLLRLPIYCQPYFGKNEVTYSSIEFNGMRLTVTGVQYYYDNTKTAEVMFTDSGFELATDYYLLARTANCSAFISSTTGESTTCSTIVPSYDLGDKTWYYNGQLSGKDYTANIAVNYFVYDYDSDSQITKQLFFTVDTDEFAVRRPSDMFYMGAMYLSPKTIHELATAVRAESYRQASLFFADDRAAHVAAEKMLKADYIAVPSDTTFELDPYETILNTFGSFFMLIVWVGVVFFIALFLSVCTRRTMDAFKSDMAIMRSMGIDVNTIKVGVFVRMYISLLPSFVFMLAAALIVFMTPKLNGLFTFLSPLQYVIIVFGMILMTTLVTYFQIRRLFKESVKKSLKGDAVK